MLVALCFVIFWGTFFPLISEAITGNESTLGPPWFDRYIVPLAIMLTLLSGIGPIIAWRRVTLANLRRSFIWPAAATAVAFLLLVVATPAEDSVASLIMFTLIAFVFAVVGQEFARGASARRLMTRESWPAAVSSLVARNRRRYGGYIVHVGVAVLFLGVAASSAFHDQADARLLPGQSAKVGDYTITYVRHDRPSGRRPRYRRADVARRRPAGRRRTARPGTCTRRATTSGRPTGAARSRACSTASRPARSTCAGARRRTSGWRCSPTCATSQAAIREADSKFGDAGPRTQGIVTMAILQRYMNKPAPMPVRAIVSPMVVWIWVGGGIALLGALLALWPSPAARRQEAAAAYKARVGGELSRV